MIKKCNLSWNLRRNSRLRLRAREKNAWLIKMEMLCFVHLWLHVIIWKLLNMTIPNVRIHMNHVEVGPLEIRPWKAASWPNIAIQRANTWGIIKSTSSAPTVLKHGQRTICKTGTGSTSAMVEFGNWSTRPSYSRRKTLTSQCPSQMFLVIWGHMISKQILP